MNIEPMLADNYSISAEGDSITVNLKQNVKWHDGNDFTSKDVIYTLDMIKSNSGIYSKTAEKIKDYNAIDNYTIQINLIKPETDFAYLLTFPVVSANAPFTDDYSFTPIGTGSYKLSSRTSTELYFEPNTFWHGGQPSEKNITVKILKDEDTATNALNVKEIDAVALESYNEDTNIPKLNAESKSITTNNMVFLGFNTTSEVMTQNIRTSICSIIDKKKLVDNNAYGKGKVCSLSINPSSWASKLNEIKNVDYDELISNDGYKQENGVYVKDTVAFCAKILVNSENAIRCNIAQGISDMLKSAGLETVIDAVPYKEYLKKIDNDDFDMFIGEVEVLPNLDPAVMLDNNNNYFNFDISFLSEVKSSLFGVYERDKIKEILNAYQDRFYLNPPYLPLYFKNDIIIYGSYVSGIEDPNLFDTFKNIENWFFYDKDGNELKESKEN